MNAIISIHNSVFSGISRLAGNWLLPSLARFSFAAVLLFYFWNSAKTKLGDVIMGLFLPSETGYYQVFPKQTEAVGFDTSQLGIIEWAITLAGTWAEFILPALIVLGLFTRIAALGMIGFVFVQSIVDIYGHGVGTKTIGAWFNNVPDSQILDQRLMWMVLFIILVVKGAGPFSLDRMLRKTSI